MTPSVAHATHMAQEAVLAFKMKAQIDNLPKRKDHLIKRLHAIRAEAAELAARMGHALDQVTG